MSKTHGYAQGNSGCCRNLPEELAQGLFEHDGVYPAVVRFSNVRPAPRSMQFRMVADCDQGAGVEGDGVGGRAEGPDTGFRMINHPVFLPGA